MAKKRYYAVRVGRTVGVFDSWHRASDQVSGHPKCLHKKFESVEEAVTFVASGRAGPVTVYLTDRTVIVDPSWDVRSQMQDVAPIPRGGPLPGPARRPGDAALASPATATTPHPPAVPRPFAVPFGPGRGTYPDWLAGHEANRGSLLVECRDEGAARALVGDWTGDHIAVCEGDRVVVYPLTDRLRHALLAAGVPVQPPPAPLPNDNDRRSPDEPSPLRRPSRLRRPKGLDA